MATAEHVWTEADVEQARRLAHAPWEFGDLLVARFPVGTVGAENPEATAGLYEFAAEVGEVEPATLRQYRLVASAWPADERSSAATWSAHLVALGWDPDPAERRALLDRLADASPNGRVTVRAVRVEVGRRRAATYHAKTTGERGLATLDVLVKGLRRLAYYVDREYDAKPLPQRARARFAARIDPLEAAVSICRALAEGQALPADAELTRRLEESDI